MRCEEKKGRLRRDNGLTRGVWRQEAEVCQHRFDFSWARSSHAVTQISKSGLRAHRMGRGSANNNNMHHTPPSVSQRGSQVKVGRGAR